jgi:hypothetical protein
MTTLFQDVRYGLRVLWKSPGFTTVAVLSLALAVANTAIFSIVNAVLLRSLPFPKQHSLQFYWNIRDSGDPPAGLGPSPVS